MDRIPKEKRIDPCLSRFSSQVSVKEVYVQFPGELPIPYNLSNSLCNVICTEKR